MPLPNVNMARLPEPTTIKEPIVVRYIHGLLRVLNLNFKGLSTSLNIILANLFDSLVIVKSKADLTDIDSTKVYVIDGIIDMGAQSIEVPETGISIAGVVGGRDVNGLISSATGYTMFTSPAGGYSGDFLLEEIHIEVTGATSKVFDIDNNENDSALDVSNVNFIDCVSLGEITDYRQVLLERVGFIDIDDGLAFSGTWSGGLAAVTSIAINFPAGATLFKEGTSLTFAGSVRSDMNFLLVDTTSEFMDFQASNILQDSGVQLDSFRTTAADVMPNLPSSSVKVKYGDCTGLRNTYVGGEFTVSTGATTTIASSNTLVKMAGTTTYDDLQWFTGSTNNEFVYISAEEIEIEVEGSLSFSGSNNREIGLQVRLWDNSASAYVDIGARYIATLNGGPAGTRSENVAFFARTVINENDRIEIWVENQTDTSNITSALGGFVGITERAS